MVEPAVSRPHRHAWTLLSGLLLVGYLAGLALLGSGAQTGNPAPWADPTNPWPTALQVGLGAGAYFAYWWPRRRETRSFSLLLTASLAVSTIALGLASYWGCRTTVPQTPFWTPLTWSLNLIGGGVNGDCGYPPALQTARLLGPLLLLITALGVLTSLFRNQYDRLSVRFGRSLVVAIGLTPESLGLIRRLAADHGPRATLAVLTETADAGLVRAVRALGGRVVTVSSIPDARALEVLLTRGSRLKVTSAYVLGTDTAVALRWVTALRELGARCDRRSTALAPRLLVRIDDPWQAEYWRRGNAYRRSRAGVTWMCDALSPYEVTASLLVDRLQQGAHDRVALVGSSPLALSVCAELAQRSRESALLGDRERPTLADVVLVGPQAERIADLHRLRQARFGNRTSALPIAADADLDDLLASSLVGARRPAVVLADEPGPAGEDGSALAVGHRAWTVFARSATTRGVAAEPVLEGLLPFGLTAEMPPDSPLDSWERAARVVHEQYRRTLTPGSTAAARPWDALDTFLKESNVRLVTATLAGVETLGRSWLPPDAGDRAVVGAGLTDEEVRRLAELEHESWRRHLGDHGWRWGATRDRARRLHPALRAWAELGPDDHERTIANVTGAVETLAALGYRATGPAPSGGSWQRYERSGEVRATRSQVAWTWRTSAGALMQAAAGDWRVSDGEQVWSVDPTIFTDTYRQLGGDRYERFGAVSGRPATPGEVVHSLEGDQVAGTGDWVLRGPAGDTWLVSTEHLAAHYRSVTSART